MQNKLWFKRKTYGWGWTPSSKEGWLIIVIYCISLFLFWNLIQYFLFDNFINLILWPIIVLLLTSTLLFVCYKKGEKPKWQWGKDCSK
jgi:hypothetical protein